MSDGSASVVINRSPAEVWAVVADITRMGEWSPECVAARWVEGATGPVLGAKFAGDNEAKVAGRTLKRWTTTSEVTACEPGSVFEFVAEGYTTWRYEMEASGVGTRLTERFQYEPKGTQGFLYEKVLRRPLMMTKGMQQTLDRIKAALEK
jgi:uncharacterized protein YndB with AHSA1/START domain